MGGGFMEKYLPTLAMLGLQFIYAGVNLLGKAALSQGMSPLVYVSYRNGIAALSLAPLTYLSQGKKAALNRGNFWLILMASFLGITLNQGLFFLGLRLGSASLATAMSNLVPAVTFLMAAPLGIEKVSIQNPRGIAKVAGTGVCVLGAITIAFYRGPKLFLFAGQNTKQEDWYLGCLFLLGSVCCWAMWLIIQVFISRTNFHPLSWSVWTCFFAFLMASSFTFIIEPDRSVWKLDSSLEIICCLFAGVLGSGVTMVVQAWCISRRGALFSAMFAPFCTVITTIMSTLFLHEELHLGSMVSAVVVIVGLYLVLWGKAEETSTRMEEIRKVDEHIVQGVVHEGRKTDLEAPLLANEQHHEIYKDEQS